jgi:hypothetical protein
MQRLVLAMLLAIVTVAVAAMSLGAYLNYGSVRASYLQLVDSRLTLIGRRLAVAIETAMQLGLPLDGQTTLPAFLERERALFSSAGRRVGAHVDPAAGDDAARLQLLPVTNDFGVQMGAVALRASSAAIDAELATVRNDIARAALLVVPCVIAAAGLGLVLVLRQAERHARAVQSGELGGTLRRVLDEQETIAARLERGGPIQAGP